MIPGDIIFTLQSRPCDGFERDNDDLIYTVRTVRVYNNIYVEFTIVITTVLQCAIPLSQAVGGVNTAVKTLDGRTLPVRAPYLTSNNAFVVVPGEGMPNRKVSYCTDNNYNSSPSSANVLELQGNTRGDLKIKFVPDFPERAEVVKILQRAEARRK